MLVLMGLMGQLWAENHPKGTLLEDAIIVDIPPQGLDAVTEVIPGLIPSPIEIPEFSDASSSCPTGGWWYKILFKRAWADILVTNAELIPQEDFIDVNIDLEIYLNDTTDLFRFNYWLVCIKYKCDGYVDPFNANVSGQISIDVTDEDGDGVNELDVNFADSLAITYDLTGDHIHLSNCPVSGIDDLFQFFGGSLYELVLNSLDLESLLQDSLPGLETTLEESFAAANIDQELDLQGTTVQLKLSPNDIDINPEGIRLTMNGMMDAEPNECIVEFDPEGSLKTDNESASLADFPAEEHLGVMVRDDFINQALYSLWSGGLLCQTIDEELFAVDSSILNLLTGDAFSALFPQTTPMTIETSPKVPLQMTMETDSDLGINLEEMGLDFFAQLDGRRTRVLAIDLTTDVGVDVALDDTSGAVGIDIDIDPQRVTSTVTSNEFSSETEEAIENSFVNQLDTILGFIDIDGLLGDLGLFMPSLPLGEEFVGIQSLNILPTGAQQEDLGVYTTLGTVPYNGCSSENSGGCAGDLGAGCDMDPSSCEGGCSTNGKADARIVLLWFVVCLSIFRRRG
jgi:hypothetical protein